MNGETKVYHLVTRKRFRLSNLAAFILAGAVFLTLAASVYFLILKRPLRPSFYSQNADQFTSFLNANKGELIAGDYVSVEGTVENVRRRGAVFDVRLLGGDVITISLSSSTITKKDVKDPQNSEIKGVSALMDVVNVAPGTPVKFVFAKKDFGAGKEVPVSEFEILIKS